MENPMALFTTWLGDAKAGDMREPTAMTLATAGKSGQPSARVVLLKSYDERGFVFYTNTQSRKGNTLAENAKAALLFYWMPLQRQVRVEGEVEPVSEKEADLYFASRHRDSQLGAWASMQSQPLENRDALMERFNYYQLQYEGQEVPRPLHWQGYRVVPKTIEFWEEAPHRLHFRRLFIRSETGWDMQLLNP